MVAVGLIGCGVMGADHARILCHGVSGGRLGGVQDADRARAEQLAGALGGVRVFGTADALIADPGIEAVLIAAPDDTHARLVLACIAAGKAVLCEKPLAATAAMCRQIVDAEIAHGRKLVQVGFMRRFDPGYRAMKTALRAGRFGAPLLLHCVHRNKVAPEYITPDLVIANSTLHEMDIARYLLEEEFAAVTVISAPPSRHSARRQPLLVVLQTVRGVVVSVEMTPDAQYGYDVRAELVCEDGTISLAPPHPVTTRRSGIDGADVDEDWRPRFAEAYRVQAQEWIAALRSGETPRGSTAWDGYAATATAEAALLALASGDRTAIRIDPRPPFYAS